MLPHFAASVAPLPAYASAATTLSSSSSSSFGEAFKTLVKQTLNQSGDVFALRDAPPCVRHAELVHPVRSGCSQPIEIDWNRRRTHSLDELDARDMHIRRKLHRDDDDDDDEWTCASPVGVDDDCIFALEL